MIKYGTCFLLLAAAAQAGELYVVPPKRGKAAQDGSRSRPFTCVTQARDAIRSAKEAGSREPWTVHLDKGVHPVSATILFEPADSGTPDAPVVYKGRGSATILSGGIEIKGWRAGGEGYWEADLPKDETGAPLYFESLYAGGRRIVRARHPNSGFLNPADVSQNELTDPATNVKFARASIQAVAGELQLLDRVPENELKFGQVVVHHKWDTTRRIIAGYDSESGTLTTQGGTWKPWNKWLKSSMYFIENVRSAFDEPGEWFYDGIRGKVLYRPLPGEKIGSIAFTVARPGLIALLHFKGDIAGGRFVENLRFEDLSFHYTDSPRRKDQLEKAAFSAEFIGDIDKPGPTQFEPQQAAARTEPAILADGARNIVIDNCELAHIGEYGIWFRSGCVGNRLQNCRIRDLGAGGIRIGAAGAEGAKPAPAAVATNTSPWCSASNVVDNCVIQGGGRFHACGVAVWIGSSADNRITHNEISDFFYTGVSVGWVWGYGGSFAQRNRICYNRIYDIGQKALGDMGGVYTLGTSFGTEVSGNVIFNIDSYTYGGWGLYTDEGSEGILMENNLVYNTKDGSFHQHYGRDNVIRNNILCNSREFQVAATRKEDHTSFVFERNIVFWQDGPTFKPKTTEKSVDWIGNIWCKVSGPVDFQGMKFSEWQAAGRDREGIEADPLFVDPSNNDFRLKPDSPALKAGFKPFDFSKAGLHTKHRPDPSWLKRLF